MNHLITPEAWVLGLPFFFPFFPKTVKISDGNQGKLRGALRLRPPATSQLQSSPHWTDHFGKAPQSVARRNAKPDALFE